MAEDSTYTVSWWKRKRWELNLQLPTVIVMIQTVHQKKVYGRYWTFYQRRNDYRNKLEHKKKKIQQNFLLGIGTRSKTPNDRIWRSSKTRQNQNRESITVYNSYYLQKRNIYNSLLFLAEQSDTETPEEIDRIRKSLRVSGFQHQTFHIKIKNIKWTQETTE